MFKGTCTRRQSWGRSQSWRTLSTHTEVGCPTIWWPLVNDWSYEINNYCYYYIYYFVLRLSVKSVFLLCPFKAILYFACLLQISFFFRFYDCTTSLCTAGVCLWGSGVDKVIIFRREATSADNLLPERLSVLRRTIVIIIY